MNKSECGFYPSRAEFFFRGDICSFSMSLDDGVSFLFPSGTPT